MAVDFRIIIPARYGSERLPGKPLLKIVGKPLIQHVYERACTSNATEIIIATDDERIHTAAQSFGAQVCMTSTDHTSGTERIAEVISLLDYDEDDIVVNLQGDEPLIPVHCLNQVAEILINTADAQVSTLCTAITSSEEIFDPNIVKVIRNRAGYALYFSRAPIPWHRDTFSLMQKPSYPPNEQEVYQRHIGLYAYRAGFIKQYVSSPSCNLEQIESLEQLRVLWQGNRIIVANAKQVPPEGIDTEQDLQRVKDLFDAQ